MAIASNASYTICLYYITTCSISLLSIIIIELSSVYGSRSNVESGTDITRSMIRDTPSSKTIFLDPVYFQKLCHVEEVFLTSLRLVDVDVVSRIDITRSMTSDSSSNKIFLVSFQRSCHVLEVFLPSLRLPSGVVV